MKKEPRSVIDSRRRILDAACEEFAEFGLAGARVDRIAAKANINKAMLYYHFSSKENLYQTILEDNLRQTLDLFFKYAAEADNLESILLNLSQAHHQFITADNKFGRIAIMELASGGKWLKAVAARVFIGHGLPQKLKKIVDQGKKEGRFRNIDSRQAIVGFIGMNLFYLIMAPMVNTVWEIKDEDKFKRNRPEILVDLFMRGLEKR